MTKPELALLEAAYSQEIEAALTNGIDVFQTRKIKLADKLVEDGYLQKCSETLGGRFPMTIKGYRLTELGRMSYCLSL